MITEAEIFNIDICKTNGLMKAISKEDIKLIREMLQLLSKDRLFEAMNHQNIYGNAVLNLACTKINLVNLLLLSIDSVERRVDLIKKQNFAGDTPLAIVAYFNNIEALKCILSFVPKDQRIELLKTPNKKGLTACGALEHFGKLAEIEEFCQTEPVVNRVLVNSPKANKAANDEPRTPPARKRANDWATADTSLKSSKARKKVSFTEPTKTDKSKPQSWSK